MYSVWSNHKEAVAMGFLTFGLCGYLSEIREEILSAQANLLSIKGELLQIKNKLK